jgi:hypothetical protein
MEMNRLPRSPLAQRTRSCPISVRVPLLVPPVPLLLPLPAPLLLPSVLPLGLHSGCPAGRACPYALPV